MHIKLTYGQNEMYFDFPEGHGVDIGTLLGSVADSDPDMYRSWCNRSGELRRALTVLVNGEHMRYRDGLQTPLKDGDEVRVIPVISGG